MKRKEDDDLTKVSVAASRFDINAPSGTYKMDRATERLIKKRKVAWVHPLPEMRWNMRNAFLKALISQRSEARFPHDCQRAADFFSQLKQLRQLMSDVIAIDAEEMSYLLVLNLSEPLGTTLTPERQIEAVEDRIDRLKAQFASDLAVVDRFANDVYLPQFINDRGGRTIGFTRSLIGEVAESWRTAFGKLDQRSDLADFTELLATALTDFDYPLSPVQRKSDEWLSDRIRKQIFRN